MDAFIPCGVPLTKSRAFVTGATSLTRNEKIVARAPEQQVPAQISAIKLPQVNLPFGKKSKSAPPPPPEPEGPVKLVIGGESITSVEKTKTGAPQTAYSRGLPKFYNSTTARHLFRADAARKGATAFDVRIGAAGSKSINERVNDQGTFRNMDPYTDNLVWARPDWSSDEARTAVNVAIRNVFGNANLFESELAELNYSISCVTKTADMREFVRALGLSEAYRSRFFEPCSNQRFVELNFKHFYGRAPHNQAEVSKHIQILTTQGYNAEINSYIDSPEYDSLWGKSRVPAVNFRGGHPFNIDMNRTAVLNGSYVTSDRVSKKAFFPTGDQSGFTSFGVYKGLPEAWRGENQSRNEAGPLNSFPDTIFWNTPPPNLQVAELEWKAKYGSWFPFYYKNSSVYKEIMTPKLTHSDTEKAEATAVLKYGSLMAKNYIGARKSFDMAPIISITPPTSGLGGSVSVAMAAIETPIPPNLKPEAFPAFFETEKVE